MINCDVTKNKTGKYGCFYIPEFGFFHNIRCPVSKQMNKGEQK
jgi:hypothetical protein